MASSWLWLCSSLQPRQEDLKHRMEANEFAAKQTNWQPVWVNLSDRKDNNNNNNGSQREHLEPLFVLFKSKMTSKCFLLLASS